MKAANARPTPNMAKISSLNEAPSIPPSVVVIGENAIPVELSTAASQPAARCGNSANALSRSMPRSTSASSPSPASPSTVAVIVASGAKG